MRQVLKSVVGGKIKQIKSIAITLNPSKGTVCYHLAVPKWPGPGIPH